ncbi:PD-(D/E)XK nuclease family transposase, partial [Bacillus sp. V2I10]
MKRLKPLNDIIFKKLFGENQDKDLLIGFLNAVLENEVEDLYIVEEK